MYLCPPLSSKPLTSVVVIAIASFADINECSSQPCQNGGVCSDATDSYECYCDGGYSGDTCGVGEALTVSVLQFYSRDAWRSRRLSSDYRRQSVHGDRVLAIHCFHRTMTKQLLQNLIVWYYYQNRPYLSKSRRSCHQFINKALVLRAT